MNSACRIPATLSLVGTRAIGIEASVSSVLSVGWSSRALWRKHVSRPLSCLGRSCYRTYLQGVENLFDRMENMVAYGPNFCDITWGAGGSTADLTLEIAKRMQNQVSGATERTPTGSIECRRPRSPDPAHSLTLCLSVCRHARRQ